MELKKCGGYKGKCHHSEDMMVPVINFTKSSASPDGLQFMCSTCRVEQHKDADPKSNAISKAAYKIAGGKKEYFNLPKEKRMELRAIAKEEYTDTHAKPEPRETIWNRKVLPFVKRNRKVKPMTKRKTVHVEGEKIPEGFVYAIRNPDSPNILKIGKTYPDGIEDRLSEARRWGRAELVGKRFAMDAVGAEKYVHSKLMHLNLRSLGHTDCGVELFKCTEQEFNDAFTDYLFVEKDNEAKISKK